MNGWIEIELVEDGRHRNRPVPGDPPPRHHQPAAVLGAAAIVAVVALAVGRSADEPGAAPDVPPRVVASTLAPPGATLPPVVTTEVDRRAPATTLSSRLAVADLGDALLPAPTGLELVALATNGDVLDIDVDAARLTTTDLPTIEHGEPRYVVTGDDWTIIQSWSSTTGYLVPQGGLPLRLSPAIDPIGSAFRSAERDAVWVRRLTLGGTRSLLELVSIDGQPLGVEIELDESWPQRSDLRGGVLVRSADGTYTAGPDGITRVSAGDVIAAGIAHLLVRECATATTCTTELVERDGGGRTPMPPLRGLARLGWLGWTADSPEIAPDGSALVVWSGDPGREEAALYEVASGESTLLAGDHSQMSLGWSDDSRFLVYLDRTLVRVFDRATRATVDLTALGPVLVFSARP